MMSSVRSGADSPAATGCGKRCTISSKHSSSARLPKGAPPMPELAFEARGAEPLRRSVSPGIALHVEAACAQPDQRVEAVILNCQVRVEAQRRRYAAAEQSPLRDLFGEPERWGETLRPL